MILYGTIIAEQLYIHYQERIKALAQRGIVPTVAVIVVGNDTSSAVYINNKKKICHRLGINFILHHCSDETGQHSVIKLINDLNSDSTIHAILCQLPLPSSINSSAIAHAINPSKDVDALHPLNQGLLTLGHPDFIPCTVRAVIQLLTYYDITTVGKRAVVVGRSPIVGRPLSILLSSKPFNATVTLCHQASSSLIDEVMQAELLFVAIGKSHYIKRHWLKDNATVIDIGINRHHIGHRQCLTGDVEEPLLHQNVSYSPVPGGVGPLTVAMLVANILDATEGLTGNDKF